jgi:hypothetical protein
VTPGATYTPVAATEFRSGTPQASSLVRYTWVLLRPTSTSQGRVGWSFVPRQTSIMQHWLPPVIMWIVRCEESTIWRLQIVLYLRNQYRLLQYENVPREWNFD